jgi:hypothetical protein
MVAMSRRIEHSPKINRTKICTTSFSFPAIIFHPQLRGLLSEIQDSFYELSILLFHSCDFCLSREF